MNVFVLAAADGSGVLYAPSIEGGPLTPDPCRARKFGSFGEAEDYKAARPGLALCEPAAIPAPGPPPAGRRVADSGQVAPTRTDGP